MLNIGKSDKIIRYSYETTKFFKKNVINYNNNNLITSFLLSKINDIAHSYRYNLNSFQKILKKLLNPIKIPYVNIGMGNFYKSNSLIQYQITKKKVPLVLEDVKIRSSNFLDISKTLESKNSQIIDNIKSHNIFSQSKTIRRDSNIHFPTVSRNEFLSLNLKFPNLHKYLKDKFQTPFGDLLNNNVFSIYVSNVSNFTFPKNKIMLSPSLPSTTFSSLHSLLEPSLPSTTFSSLHSLLEPSLPSTTFSSLHSLLEPSLPSTTFSSLHSLLEPSLP